MQVGALLAKQKNEQVMTKAMELVFVYHPFVYHTSYTIGNGNIVSAYPYLSLYIYIYIYLYIYIYICIYIHTYIFI